MKLRATLIGLIGVGLSMGTTRAADNTKILNFDDLSVGFEHIQMPSGYGGLQWNIFSRVVSGWNQPWNSGYRKGMVSPNNVAFNANGNPVSIDRAEPFDLDSAYLTAGVLNGLQLLVLGYVGSTLTYSSSYTLNTTEPILANFDFRGVTQVRFITTPDSQFAMDHLTVTFPGPTDPECPVAIGPRSRLHQADTGTGSVTVTVPTGCSWSVSNDLPWVTITSGLDYVGSGAVTYTVAVNPTAVARDGFIYVGGQPFAVSQAGDPTADPRVPFDVGQLQPTTVGHSFVQNMPFPPAVADFLIDQDQSSGGGSVLPPVAVNWDTNSQFTLTISAPPGQKFLVQVPPGRLASFAGFLSWESTRGGNSPYGSVKVRFDGLEGTAPDFTDSESVLSASHGYFGFSDITSSPFSGELAFTAISLTGYASPQVTGAGTESYVAHHASYLQISYKAPDLGLDPGPFVSLVPITGVAPRIQLQEMSNDSGARLRVQGKAGLTIVVEASEDFVHWTPIGTDLMPFTVCAICPFVIVDDPEATKLKQRFYRVYELR